MLGKIANIRPSAAGCVIATTGRHYCFFVGSVASPPRIFVSANTMRYGRIQRRPEPDFPIS